MNEIKLKKLAIKLVNYYDLRLKSSSKFEFITYLCKMYNCTKLFDYYTFFRYLDRPLFILFFFDNTWTVTIENNFFEIGND